MTYLPSVITQEMSRRIGIGGMILGGLGTLIFGAYTIKNISSYLEAKNQEANVVMTERDARKNSGIFIGSKQNHYVGEDREGKPYVHSDDNFNAQLKEARNKKTESLEGIFLNAVGLLGSLVAISVGNEIRRKN